MFKKIYLIPRRNDLDGIRVFIGDLRPDTMTDVPYLGEGQTHYVVATDWPGVTVVKDNFYVSGSTMTTLNAVQDPLTAYGSTGGADDVKANPRAAFGLASYLRERVQPGGKALATAAAMSITNANLQANAIMAEVSAGQSITLAVINAILSNVGLGGTANTDLDGAAALSRSFGSVEDILKILSGAVYKTPEKTIITNVADQFQSAAQRAVFVAAATSAFYASGDFIESTEAGYRGTFTYAFSYDVVGSAQLGELHAWSNDMAILNTTKYAYTAADVTAFKPRALTAAMANIPATGIAKPLAVYTDTGMSVNF